MNIPQRRHRTTQIFALILIPLLTHTGVPLDLEAQDKNASEVAIRRTVSTIIQKTIENSRTRLKDGSYATTMPVLPSAENSQEIKQYGDRAVSVLSAYVNSDVGLEQHIAVRLLLEFHDDSALSAIRGFAEKSRFPGIRQSATMALTGFSPNKAKPIITSISERDPDPDVRAFAIRALATLETTEKKQHQNR